jgi:hypothetical protein
MDAKKQIVDRLQTATSILVTVSNNPSVDQLAACIGLTLALNKLDKHATAVFSGAIPDTIEFLKPEQTIEQTTDSLRDFIIALDKSKADKLRYKVEDRVVKIFITPYRTSISENDLNFSQGDLNVDVVIALGVREQQDLDQAITAHGRILHDATVITISSTGRTELGSINWLDERASSLSEMVTQLSKQLGKKLLDGQIATALLTGIVAATDRFRNAQTSAQTMNVSADLMAAGANQQLVTSQLDHELNLQQPGGTPPPQIISNPKLNPNEGLIEMAHEGSLNQHDESTFLSQQGYNLPPPPPGPSFASPDVVAPSVSLGPEPEGPLPTIHAVHGHPDESKEPVPYYGPGEAQTFAPPPAAPLFGSASSGIGEDDEKAFDPLAPPESTDQNPKLLSHDQPAANDTGGITLPAAPTASDQLPGSFDVPKPEQSFAPPSFEPPAPDFTATPVTGQPDSGNAWPSASDAQNTAEPPEAPVWNPTPEPSAAPDLSQPAMTPPAPSFTPEAPMPADPTSEPPQVQAQAEPTLSELEQTVSSPAGRGEIDVDEARNEVMRALSEQVDDTEPVQALNAQPLGDPLHGQPVPPTPVAPPAPAASSPVFMPQAPPVPPAGYSPADQPLDMPMPAQVPAPPSFGPPQASATPPSPQFVPPTNEQTPISGATPPPGPPPMVPPSWPS